MTPDVARGTRRQFSTKGQFRPGILPQPASRTYVGLMSATEALARIDDEGSPGDPDPPARVAHKKHPLALRWMHWVNFPVMLVMVYSGMRIYWANRVYAFGIGDWQLFKFWPTSVYRSFHLNAHLARGIAYHLTFAWIFVLNGLAYVLFLAFRGNWRHVLPDRQAMKDAPMVVLHDLKLRKHAPASRGKYNAAQRMAYTAVVVMATLLVVSGFAIYKPTQLAPLTAVLGGYTSARIIHFSMTILLMLFFLTHILQVVRAGWRNFASMISGYELDRKAKRRAGAKTEAGVETQ